MNIGHSSKLLSDEGIIRERLHESLGPGKYRLDTDRIHNKRGCLNLVGPIGSRGISHAVGDVVAPKQQLADVESYLSNRHLKHTKMKKGRVNLGGVNKFRVRNDRICGGKLAPRNTLMTHPRTSYRGMSVNRFYNPLRDPQRNLDPPRAVNTSLEAKDNWVPQIPKSMRTISQSTSIPVYPSSELSSERGRFQGRF